MNTWPKWGVFEKDTDVHVCPCTKHGYVLASHTLTRACECRPVYQYPGWNTRLQVIHHDWH